MVQLLPLHHPGAMRFFTVSLADPAATTLVDEILALRAAVRAVREVFPFRIEAWVVMPNHLHAIWSLPPGDDDFQSRWSAIMTRFSKSVNDRALTPKQAILRDSGLWHPKIEMRPIDDREDFRACLTHCWMDPVRHGYVSDPEDWPYSSYHRDARRGVCSEDRVANAVPPGTIQADQASILT